MFSEEHLIKIDDVDREKDKSMFQKREEKMQVETSNKDTVTEFDQEDEDMFQKVDEKVQGETSNKDTEIELDQEEENMFQKLQERKTKEEERKSSNEQGQGGNQVTKIQRVPDVMEAEKKGLRKEYFEPKAISIGPIHAHSKNDFLVGDDDLKLTWAAKYLDGLEQKQIFKGIKREIDSLKDHFDKKYLDGIGARMLFLDGCAMLQFIHSFVSGDFVKQLNINAALATVVQQDLFLLENQIPFRVLQIIMNGGKKEQTKEVPKKLYETKKAVKSFIHMSNMSCAPLPTSSLMFDDGVRVVHLLDLLRRSLLDDPDHSSRSEDCSNGAFSCLQSFIKYSVLVIFKIPFFVLRFLVCLPAIIVVIFSCMIYTSICLVKKKASCCVLSKFLDLFFYLCVYGFGIRIPKSPITRRSFRNVQELKAAGIELKPSKSRCLKEVSFSSGLFGGCLRLCPIMVDNSTAGKLLNLVAYEMCPDYHRKIPEDSEKNDYRISSYLSFLDSLIDNEQDVKDLRAANILRHRLSCDKDVAELFNSISPNSVADDAYGDVNSKIQDYYEWTIRIWITEFRREHLNSPWRLLALIAAAAALGLTAAQTYFAINPR